jgi:hypothetical protein
MVGETAKNSDLVKRGANTVSTIRIKSRQGVTSLRLLGPTRVCMLFSTASIITVYLPSNRKLGNSNAVATKNNSKNQCKQNLQ